MDPASIALQRKASSDSADSLRPPDTPVRKGRKKGPKQYAKTNLNEIKGDALRTPPSPYGTRHSDRAPEKRVRVLREDGASEDETTVRKKRIRKRRPRRQTRSLSPMGGDRRDNSTSTRKEMSWTPGDLIIATPSETDNPPQEAAQANMTENEKRLLGSLIHQIEAEFGAHQEMAVFHESTASMPAIPVVYSSDDDHPEHLDDYRIRDSPDADALLSSASIAEKSESADPPGDPPQEQNAKSLGTTSTAASSLSTSFEESMVGIFSNLKPLSDHDKGNASSRISLSNPRTAHGSIKRKQGKKTRRKRDSASTSSKLSTIGEGKGAASDSAGTVNSIDTTQQMMEGVGGKSLSALDTSEIMTPKTKKEVLRATAHCSPLQVSKHTGLSSSSHGKSRVSSSSSSTTSAYLLERLPLEPLLSADISKEEETTSPTGKAKQSADDSVDQSVQPFHAPVPVTPEKDESTNATESNELELAVEADSESLSREEKTEKKTSALAATLALLSPNKSAKGIGRRPRSSDTCAESIELFSQKKSTPAAVVDAADSRPERQPAPPDPYGSLARVEETAEPSESSEASYSLTNGLYQIPFATPKMKATTDPPSELSSSQSETRRNPPARPWAGRTPEANESLASSIKELSVASVDKDSMLNVLITSLEKEGLGVEKRGDSLEELDLSGSDKKQAEIVHNAGRNHTKESENQDASNTATKMKEIWTVDEFDQACELLSDALARIDSAPESHSVITIRGSADVWLLQHANVHGRSRVYLSRQFQTSVPASSAKGNSTIADEFHDDSVYEDPDAVQGENMSVKLWHWHVTVVYSETWQTPTLYFRVEDAYRGEPCSRTEVINYLTRMHYRNNVSDTWDFVSQDEHPITGTPCFFLHPCRTNESLNHLAKHDDPAVRLLQWMSILLPSIGITITSKEFIEVVEVLTTEGADRGIGTNKNGACRVDAAIDPKKNKPQTRPKTPTRPKPSQRPKSPKRVPPKRTKSKESKTLDTDPIASPGTASSRPKTPTRAHKPKVPTAEEPDEEPGNAPPRRRIRSRKPASRIAPNAHSVAKKVSGSASPTCDMPNARPRRKTPTKARPGPGTPQTPGGKKTPTRPRVVESGEPSDKRKTPTRNRPSLSENGRDEGVASSGRKLGISGTGTGSMRRKTPTKTRNSQEHATISDGTKTPTRSRPMIDRSALSGRSEMKAEGGVSKTPKTRKKKIIADGSPLTGDMSGEAENNEPKAPKTRVPKTPANGRKRAVSAPITDGSPQSSKDAHSPEISKLSKLEAPQTPTRVSEKMKIESVAQTNNTLKSLAVVSPESPGAHSETQTKESAGRTSTPTRVRRILGAAAERVVAALRTPPRERKTFSLSPDEETIRESERSFSPFSRLRRLRARTPSREHLLEEQADENRKTVISQTPTRGRVKRTKSRSLSPAPQRNSLKESEMIKRPSSAGRPRRLLKVSDTKEAGITDSLNRRKTPIHTREGSFSSKSSAGAPRTPSRRRRVSDSQVAEEVRTKTPTRSRRVRRVPPNPDSERPSSEKQVSGRVLRPRRRGGDRGESFTSRSSEKPAVETPSQGNERRKTPIRGRSPRPRTPTKSREKVTSTARVPTPQKEKTLRRVSSEQKFAPDPPGQLKNKSRSRSLNKSRRGRSQTRSRSPSDRLASASHESVTQLPLDVPLR